LLSRALESYVARRKKERFAEVEAPRPVQSLETQSVPADVRRQAFEKSGGQCEFRSEDGRRCSARAFLEVDHVIPRALGGGHGQIRLFCRAHNLRAAELAMGEEAMAEARRRAERERDVAAALKNLGFSANVSRKASAEAVREEGSDADLTSTIGRALRLTERHVSHACEGGPVWLYEPSGGLVTTG
jgi:hypothetical protein